MSKCEQCIVRELSSLRTLQKDELLKIASCKTSKVVRKGEHIFDEGDPINGLYCVKDGVCKLTKLSPNGKEQIVKLVKKGELLGQRSMISEEPANLSAVALADMEICFIPKSEVLGLFNSNHNFSMNVMRTICGDLKDADNLMVSMAQKSMKERLAYVLLYLADTFGSDGENYLNLVMSREEIAGMTGVATESAIRLLSDLNKQNLIELSGKRIKILDRSGLHKISG